MRGGPAAKIRTVRSGMAQVVHVANPVVASAGVIEYIPQAESALVKPPNKSQLTRSQHSDSSPMPGPGLSTSPVVRRPSLQNTATAPRPPAERQTATLCAPRAAVIPRLPTKAGISRIPVARSAVGTSTTTRPRAQTAPARLATAPVKPAPRKLVTPRLRTRNEPAPAAAPCPAAKPSVTPRRGAQSAPPLRPATKRSVGTRPVQTPAVARPTPKIARPMLKSTAPALRPSAQTCTLQIPVTAGRPRAYRPSAPTPPKPMVAAGPVKPTTVATRIRSYRAQAVAAADPGRPTIASARRAPGSSTSSTSNRRLLRF